MVAPDVNVQMQVIFRWWAVESKDLISAGDALLKVCDKLWKDWACLCTVFIELQRKALLMKRKFY